VLAVEDFDSNCVSLHHGSYCSSIEVSSVPRVRQPLTRATSAGRRRLSILKNRHSVDDGSEKPCAGAVHRQPMSWIGRTQRSDASHATPSLVPSPAERTCACSSGSHQQVQVAASDRLELGEDSPAVQRLVVAIGESSESRKNRRSAISNRVGAMSYCSRPRYITTVAYTPVSSYTSRTTASSGDSSSSIDPAGTWTPVDTRGAESGSS
jgi:hypothetical protein